MFFKYFVKMWIAVYLVSHTFDIAMAVFDIGQSVVNSSSGIIRGNTAIDIRSLSMQMQAAMATMATVSYTHLDVYKRQILSSFGLLYRKKCEYAS